MFDVNTRNGSCVMAKIAGIESTAKITSTDDAPGESFAKRDFMSVAVQREVDRERGHDEHTETGPDGQRCDRLQGRGLYVESASVWQAAAGRETCQVDDQLPNASASSVCCSMACAFAEPVAGLADAERRTERNGRPSRSRFRRAMMNARAPMFAGSSCTHTKSCAFEWRANSAASSRDGNGTSCSTDTTAV